MSSATDSGAPEVTSFTENEAADEFLKRFMPADADDNQPSDDENKPREQEQETHEEETPDEHDEPSDEGNKDPEDDDESSEVEDEKEKEDKRKYADGDDSYVKIKVGDEEHEVPVKDLKRLYGQEASLTKKSMEVAEQRKAVDGELAKASAGTTALLERAKARWEPYSKIDFLLASKELEPEQYTALRNEAQAAYDDVQFLSGHLDNLMTNIRDRQEQDLAKAARESLKVLTGPAEQGGIDGFDEKLYDDIRAFAVSEGAPPELINRLVDSWAIRLLYDAMLYKRGKAKSKVIVHKVNKTPKKVIKTTTTSRVNEGKSNADRSDKAMKRLRTTGSTDDAAEAFLARWSDGEAND